jgi:hypothetical protein
MIKILPENQASSSTRQEMLVTPGSGGGAEAELSASRWDFESELMDDVNCPADPSLTLSNFCQTFRSYFTSPNNFNARYLDRNPNLLADITNSIAKFTVVDFDSLWQDISKIQANQYENDLVSLPHWKPALPPTNQAVLYTDDGQSTTFTLNAGKVISSAATKMYAELTLTNNETPGTNAILYSDQIQINGDDVKVAFPAISNMASAVTNPSELDLVLQTNNETSLTNSYCSFMKLNGKNAVPPPAWKILRTYGLLLAGPTNQFSIVLATNAANPGTSYLDIENPQVLSQTNGGVLGNSINGVYPLVAQNVTNNNLVTFTFGPLITGQTVSFDLLDQDQKFIAVLTNAMVYPPNSSQTSSSASPASSGH